jgi:hypothetical protein
MMCSYYDSNELEMAKKVKDKELNELLQDVRAKDDRYYLQERTWLEKRGLFKKSVEKTGYTLLLNISGTECQVINFCQDHEWSINPNVSKSYIHALFCGWLNGFKIGQEQQLRQKL